MQIIRNTPDRVQLLVQELDDSQWEDVFATSRRAHKPVPSPMPGSLTTGEVSFEN